jgi:hypothetical protein
MGLGDLVMEVEVVQAETAVVLVAVVVPLEEGQEEEGQEEGQQVQEEAQMMLVTATTMTLMKENIPRDLRLRIDDYNTLRVNSGKNESNTLYCSG